MIEVLRQANAATKLAIAMVMLGIITGGIFLWLAIVHGGPWGNPPKYFANQFVMFLLSVISLQSALYLWNRSVIPAIFLTMCRLAREMGSEDMFVEACRPECGDTPSRIANRIGISGLFRAFNKSMPISGH